MVSPTSNPMNPTAYAPSSSNDYTYAPSSSNDYTYAPSSSKFYGLYAEEAGHHTSNIDSPYDFQPTPEPTSEPTTEPISQPTATEPILEPTTEPISQPTDDFSTDDFSTDDYSTFYYYGYYDDFEYSPGYFNDDVQSLDDNAGEAGHYYESNDDALRGQTTDDFSPTNPINYDNGKIFEIGFLVAQKLNQTGNNDVAYCQTSPPFNCSNGDVFLSNAAYEALLDTLGSPNSNFTTNFDSLCSANAEIGSVSAGCALLAFEVNGGQNRDISDYYFQPASAKGTVAFANTLYSAQAFQAMQTPPTSLTQIFYQCVMTQNDAVTYATALAKSNAEIYMGILLTIWMTVLVFCLNDVAKVKPPVKTITQKNLALQREKEEEEAKREALAIFTMSLFEDLSKEDQKKYVDKAKKVIEDKKKANAKGTDDGADKGGDVEMGSKTQRTPSHKEEQNPMVPIYPRNSAF